MPGFDKSGPQGAGPMTGGGRGNCRRSHQQQRQAGRAMSGRGRRQEPAGVGRGFWDAMEEIANAFRRRRAGRGSGRGFGRGGAGNPSGGQAENDCWNPPSNAEQEKEKE